MRPRSEMLYNPNHPTFTFRETAQRPSLTALSLHCLLGTRDPEDPSLRNPASHPLSRLVRSGAPLAFCSVAPPLLPAAGRREWEANANLSVSLMSCAHTERMDKRNSQAGKSRLSLCPSHLHTPAPARELELQALTPGDAGLASVLVYLQLWGGVPNGQNPKRSSFALLAQCLPVFPEKPSWMEA